MVLNLLFVRLIKCTLIEGGGSVRVGVFSTVLIIPTHSLANVYRLDPEMLNVRTMF